MLDNKNVVSQDVQSTTQLVMNLKNSTSLTYPAVSMPDTNRNVFFFFKTIHSSACYELKNSTSLSYPAVSMPIVVMF